MEWCYKCGVSSNEAVLYDALAGKGVVKVCASCLRKENIPVLKKPTQTAIKAVEKPKAKVQVEVPVERSVYSQKMYNRLSKLSGVEIKQSTRLAEVREVRRPYSGLREVVNKNVRQMEEQFEPEDLVENFHWLIMRSRRAKKLTQEQFAREIDEPILLIKKAEEGIIGRGNGNFVRKLETYLHIRIIKDKPAMERPRTLADIKFDSSTARDLAISDLKELRREKEKNVEEQRGGFFSIFKRKKEKAQFDENLDISDSEIDRLIANSGEEGQDL
jgi:ribosome-binding protein aMBF1 (putative translation factor)